jgi:hypothetical protein
MGQKKGVCAWRRNNLPTGFQFEELSFPVWMSRQVSNGVGGDVGSR